MLHYHIHEVPGGRKSKLKNPKTRAEPTASTEPTIRNDRAHERADHGRLPPMTTDLASPVVIDSRAANEDGLVADNADDDDEHCSVVSEPTSTTLDGAGRKNDSGRSNFPWLFCFECWSGSTECLVSTCIIRRANHRAGRSIVAFAPDHSRNERYRSDANFFTTRSNGPARRSRGHKRDRRHESTSHTKKRFGICSKKNQVTTSPC
jgi:hypothetical protein